MKENVHNSGNVDTEKNAKVMVCKLEVMVPFLHGIITKLLVAADRIVTIS